MMAVAAATVLVATALVAGTVPGEVKAAALERRRDGVGESTKPRRAPPKPGKHQRRR